MGINADQRRRMNEGLSKRMTREAENRRCPECGRGFAVNSDREDWGHALAVLRWCRWADCDYESVNVYELGPPK